MVVAAAIKTAATTLEARTIATLAMVLVMITLAALAIALFVTCCVNANTIASDVAIANAFVGV
jgi:hypothetical protein